MLESNGSPQASLSIKIKFFKVFLMLDIVGNSISWELNIFAEYTHLTSRPRSLKR